MKKINITLIITLLTLTTIQAESIGFVDMQEIFQGYKKVIDFQKNIEKKAEDYEKKLSENQEKIKKAEEAGKSKKELEKRIVEIQEKNLPHTLINKSLLKSIA